MRVLWVVNQPIAYLREMLKLPLGQSGGWMETSYASLKNSRVVTLGVAAIYMGQELMHGESDGHHFFAVPSRQPIGMYSCSDKYNITQWKKVIDEFKPDVIQLWGTEYAMGACAQMACHNIPSVVYMQGQMSMIAKHYCDGIGNSVQWHYMTLWDIKNRNFFWNRKHDFEISAQREAKILSMSKNVIVESDWCAFNCRTIVPECNVFRSKLPINDAFFHYDWSYENCEKHSIFTVAGGYPIKGHHILLKALSLVKKVYPDVKLYIPGASNILSTSLKDRLRRNTYDNYIGSLIREYDLSDNIVLTGRLTPEQMAEQLCISNLYVMPSSCENHCSSLIEAMIVGIPTISSYVGGLSQYYKDGINGHFYRFNEPEVLASLIVHYFQNREYAIKIAEAGKIQERKSRESIDLKSDFEYIYHSIINKA